MLDIFETDQNLETANIVSVLPSTKTELPATEQYIFVLMEERSAWETGKRFKRLNGILHKSGWYIHPKHQATIEAICNENNLHYYIAPLPTNWKELEKNTEIELLVIYQDHITRKINLVVSKLGFDWDINKGHTIENLLDEEYLPTLKKSGDGLKVIELIGKYQEHQENINRLRNTNLAISDAKQDQLIAKQILTADNLLDDQEQRLAKYRGQEFLGLCQKTLSKLDDNLSGLRKFILLAAAPNIGKTALTIQLGIDTIKSNPEACLIYVSLEMTREDIFDRMRCHLTPMTHRKLYFGSVKNNNDRGWYTNEEMHRLSKSLEELRAIGNRILIIDEECCPNIDAETILSHVEDLKSRTNSKNVIVVIDYLQVLPIPESIAARLHGDNDADRYRISQMKKLRNALGNDPLIVISEARKPSGTDKWATSMADILGSSRIAYGIDAGLLLNPLSDGELAAYIKDKKTTPTPTQKRESSDDGAHIRSALAEQGISLVNLTIDKGRDGMQKGTILLTYYFNENRFEEASWHGISNMYTSDTKSLKEESSTASKPESSNIYAQMFLGE
jgi:KaiC/GvpD/RAD55 family RecA-like ATPase